MVGQAAAHRRDRLHESDGALHPDGRRGDNLRGTQSDRLRRQVRRDRALPVAVHPVRDPHGGHWRDGRAGGRAAHPGEEERVSLFIHRPGCRHRGRDHSHRGLAHLARWVDAGGHGRIHHHLDTDRLPALPHPGRLAGGELRETRRREGDRQRCHSHRPGCLRGAGADHPVPVATRLTPLATASYYPNQGCIPLGPEG